MKTITELNSKWWYRLLKLSYVLLFITIFLSSSFLIYNLKAPKNGNIREAFEYASKNENSDFAKQLTSLVYTGCLDDEAKKSNIDLSPFKKMILSKNQVKEILENAPKEANKDLLIEKLVERGYILEGFNDSQYKIDDCKEFLGMSEVSNPWKAWKLFVLYEIAFLILILALFEGVKRSFYFVLLGKVKI